MTRAGAVYILRRMAQPPLSFNYGEGKAKDRMAKQSSPRVYSYLRFSTPEQKLGDSERRQLESFAKRHKLPLDTSVMADRGLSAYHGHHRTKGALGQFLKLIEAGEVPKGSILYVENIDRLSRLEMLDALELLLFGIIKHDVSIASDDVVYNRESLNTGMVWRLIGEIQRAHAESKRKSEFSQANWQNKRKLAREEKRVITKRVPNWLRVVDGEHEIIPERADSIRMLFDLKLKGLGLRTIAQRLNAEAPWKPENGWRDSYIKKCLSNRAVLGEYQPHKRIKDKRVPDGDPIPGYYPTVVEPELFYAVQERLEANRGKGGRKDRCGNLFTELARCAYCGGSMRFKPADSDGSPRHYAKLQCDNGRRQLKCRYAPAPVYSIRYDETERTILNNCRGLSPEQVLPQPDEQAKKVAAIRKRVAGKEVTIREIDQQIENFLQRVGKTSDEELQEQYEARIAALKLERSGVEGQLKEDQHELREAETDLASFTNWTKQLADLHDAISSDDSLEVRLALRSHLRDLITRIDVYAEGFLKEYTPDDEVPIGQPKQTEDLAHELAGVVSPTPSWRNKQWRRFAKWLTAKRMSKAGRFLRVHFRTGATIDLVPSGSVASGCLLERDGRGKQSWRLVHPAFDRLWQEFQTQDVERNGRG